MSLPGAPPAATTPRALSPAMRSSATCSGTRSASPRRSARASPWTAWSPTPAAGSGSAPQPASYTPHRWWCAPAPTSDPTAPSWRPSPPQVLAIHAHPYRNPAALPPGKVLVLGSGQTGCHDLHYRTLQAMGVQLLGRLAGVQGHRASFAGDLADSVAFGDARYRELRKLLCDQLPTKRSPRPSYPTPHPSTPTPQPSWTSTTWGW
jgi:hypothetical protein